MQIRESIEGLYSADPARYAAATQGGLDCLADRGLLRCERDGDVFEVSEVRDAPTTARPVRRPLAKFIYLLALLKSIATFGDWLPYVLWKLERHTGNQVELTERQRRHPLIWGWPVLLRVLWQRDLR